MIKIIEKIINIGLILIIFLISYLPWIFLDEHRNFIYYGLLFIFISTVILKRSLKMFISGKGNLLFWIYLLGLSFGIFFAREKTIARNKGYEFIFFAVCIFFICKINYDKKKYLNLIRILLTSAVVVSIFGLFEFIFKKNFIYEYLFFNPFYEKYRFLKRAMSTMIHPVVLASYLTSCLPFSFSMAILSKRAFLKNWWKFCSISIFTALILTFTRMGFIAVIISICVNLIAKKRKILLKKFILLSLLVIILFTLLTFTDRYSPFSRFGVYGLLNPYPFYYRFSRLISTLKIIKEHPFFGLGINNYRLFFDKYHSFKNASPELKIPDNMYLMILGETGLFGFLTFLFFIFYVLKKGLYYFSNKISDEAEKEMILALCCSLIALLVNMLTYDLFYWLSPLFLFWIVVGMITGITNKYPNNA